MGKIEQEVKKEVRRQNIQHAILSTLAVGGIMTIALLAPNVIGALDKIFDIRKRLSLSSSVHRSIRGALETGYIVVAETDRGKVFRLTDKGRRRLHSLELKTFRLKKPRRWDKRFRIIIFDIKEKRKNTRNRLSFKLKSLGFLRLQDSVWVYPYDCEDFLTLLKAELRIGKDVLYVVAQKVENDRWLRDHFSLK